MTITDEDISHMRTCASYGKRYHTDVEVSYLEIFCGDPIKNHQLVSMAATGSTEIQELSMQVVDMKGTDTLVLHVSGFVDKVVEELNAFQLTGGNAL